jgi:hypothetical protein
VPTKFQGPSCRESEGKERVHDRFCLPMAVLLGCVSLGAGHSAQVQSWCLRPTG